MNRSRTITGLVFIAVTYFGWNTFGATITAHVFSTNSSVAVPQYIPFTWFVVALVGWYATNWVNAINEWNRRPVLLFGRYVRTAGPGFALIEPLFYTTLEDVPVQDITLPINAERVQTKDNVSTSLNGLLTLCVAESKVRDAVVQVKNVMASVTDRGLSTLTDTAAATDLDHLLENRPDFCAKIAETLKERVKAWGVDIKAFELKGFKINDPKIEEAIAMKARAVKEAAAELTRAEKQGQIAVALNEAASKLDERGWKLKEMEILIELCRSAQNNTILIPTNIQNAVGQLTKLFGAKDEGARPAA